ncbi:MAG: hypothetical protein ACK4N5_26540, partial [Myxococcales bacterium]
MDAGLSLPLIVTAILIVTAVGNSSRWVVVLIIGFIFTPVVSRTVRAAVLSEAELDQELGDVARHCRDRGGILGERLAPKDVAVILDRRAAAAGVD